MRCLKLPLLFDRDRLRDDLALIEASEWVPHMNRRKYDGEWSGVPLRSIDGSLSNIVPDAPELSAFRDTTILARCGYFREVLATFRCPLRAVRLLRLHAGSNIAEHVDHALDFDSGEVRLHIPILTNDDVQFFLDGARLVMAPGECWYTNVNLPHSVENRSATDRIHLVLDCVVDDWLREVFASTPRLPPDHYSARLSLATPPPLDRVIATVAGLASRRTSTVRFAADGSTLILAWPDRHTWQLRLRLETPDTGWSALLESSPDPERRHQADIAELLSIFAHEFPGLALAHTGLA